MQFRKAVGLRTPERGGEGTRHRDGGTQAWGPATATAEHRHAKIERVRPWPWRCEHGIFDAPNMNSLSLDDSNRTPPTLANPPLLDSDIDRPMAEYRTRPPT
jgi:hypothetical protein